MEFFEVTMEGGEHIQYIGYILYLDPGLSLLYTNILYKHTIFRKVIFGKK